MENTFDGLMHDQGGRMMGVYRQQLERGIETRATRDYPAELPLSASPPSEAQRQMLLDRKQMIEDAIATRHANNDSVPDGWLSNLAKIDIALTGDHVAPDAIYGRVMEGHPLFDSTNSLPDTTASNVL